MSISVLVTGGSGFVGTWVLRSLMERGLAAVALDAHENRPRWERLLGSNATRVPFVSGSLLDRALLAEVFERHRISHVIHLAALLTPACQQDPFLGCEVNVLGSVALFEQAVRSKIQGLSYASSLAVFGPEPDSAGGLLATAAPENRSPSFYGAFKKAMELIAEQYWMHAGLPSVGIRPHVVYGPERDQGLTAGPSLAARAAAEGRPFQINYRGVVGYDYVEDVANAFVQTALQTPPGSIVVDLPSEAATVEQLVTAIDLAVPGSARTITIEGPTLPRNDSPRTDLITNVLPDWRATSIVDGIQRTVDFYR
ncbi:NAD-dependent epimerase/dehydratase family protein [Schlesneria paludicola]|uniref:NAD-dependent epimerase/dehydratase family protein n=1 Tax=Schlesneria paludicola TaxID=360056 RepID=UPI00029ADA53|nr:NAD(P)-dependent oxidoreductase [Schlesneria paludicola]